MQQNSKKIFKILIADDEALARYAIRTLLSKNFTNLEIVGEAENGNEVIEMNRTLKPDLVVMDIRMPGINGIDASSQILTEFPKQNILLVTAYDNFNYVQQAIDLGVKGYILKPIKKEEIIEKFNKILESISTENDISQKPENIESKINVVKPFLEKELVSAFISGSFETEEIKSYINFLQENIEHGYFMLVSIGEDISRHINDALRNSIVKEKVLAVINQYLKSLTKCIIGPSIGNIIIVFIPADSQIPFSDHSKSSIFIASELKNRIRLTTKIDVSIGIGLICSGISNFKISYEQANNALRKAIRENSIEVFCITAQERTRCRNSYPYNLENEFIEYLKIGKSDQAKRIISQILDHIFVMNNEPENIKEHVVLLVTMLNRTMSQLDTEFARPIATNLATLVNLDQIDEIKIWALNATTSMMEEFEKIRALNKNIRIKQLQECVNNPYSYECTLENAAQKVGVTPQYLSKIFKDEFKTNFIDYVKDKRISYAKELLLSSEKNIRDISKLVGYENPNYFCRIFKKTTGMTPKEYKLMRQE